MEFPTIFDAHGLHLRPFQDADVPSMVASLNDPLTQRFQQGRPVEMTAERALGWITAAPTRFAPGGDRVVHAIADPQTDGLLAGTLMIIESARATAEIGFWVDPSARGRGVATATARALTDLCFACGVHRVEMLIRWENTISLRVALAAGFQPEAELRSVIPGADGERHDAVLWSRLPSDDPEPALRLTRNRPGDEVVDAVVTLLGAARSALRTTG